MSIFGISTIQRFPKHRIDEAFEIAIREQMPRKADNLRCAQIALLVVDQEHAGCFDVTRLHRLRTVTSSAS